MAAAGLEMYADGDAVSLASPAGMLRLDGGVALAVRQRILPAVENVVDRDDLCPDVAKGPVPDPNKLGCPFQDKDGDGIPDSREAALATSAQNADTDGDGLYDFFEMLLGKNPAVPGNSAPVPGATGLQIHSPSPSFWPVSRETSGN